MRRSFFGIAAGIALLCTLLSAGIGKAATVQASVTIGKTPMPTIAPKAAKPKKTSKSKKTPKPKASATPVPTQAQTGAIAPVSSGYISEVLRGINETRALEGNSALAQDESMNQLAQAHAQRMAEAKSMFHSDYFYIESVAMGSEDAMVPLALGVRSSVHAPEIKDRPDLQRVGIGGCVRDGRIYACVIAE